MQLPIWLPTSRFRLASFQLLLVFLSGMGVRSFAQAPHSHGQHPIMPGQALVIRYRISGGSSDVELPLEVKSLAEEQTLNQAIRLPPPHAPLQVTRFLPAGEMVQMAVADPKGHPAIELHVEGPTQAYRRWLLADDPERNRLTSLIATWRFMAADSPAQRDELFSQFEKELKQEPRLLIRRLDGGLLQSVAFAAGGEIEIPEFRTKVQMVRFYPHFAKDKDSASPINRSEKRVNPAALVRIDRGDTVGERWLFAKYPQFEADLSMQLPFQLILECASEGEREIPDIAIIAREGGSSMEVWTRYSGQTASRRLEPGEQMAISGSQYHFSLSPPIGAARLVEEYRSTPDGKGVPAVLIESPPSDGPSTRVWLELGKARLLPTPSGPLTVLLATKSDTEQPQHKHQ